MSKDDSQDAAAEAFEALRAEVAHLRAMFKGLSTAPPDYAPTLAAMAQSLAAMEAHPALRLTPQALALQIREVTESAQQHGRRELASAVQRVDAAGANLERLAARARTGREHIRHVAILSAVSAVIGVIVWLCISGPIARALPAGWSVPERMAAATLRLDRWTAGARLMQSADPQAWSHVVDAWVLERDNRNVLAACRSVAVRSKTQWCTVKMPPLVRKE